MGEGLSDLEFCLTFHVKKQGSPRRAVRPEAIKIGDVALALAGGLSYARAHVDLDYYQLDWGCGLNGRERFCFLETQRCK